MVPGQEDRECTASARLTLNIHRSAQITDDGVHERKTEPGARADFLGCEKWLEEALEHIWHDSATRIPHEQAYIFSRQQCCRGERTRLSERKEIEAYDERAAGLHCLLRVRAQIHHDSVDLGRVT